MINNKYLVGNGFIGKNLKKIKRDIINSKYTIYAAGISHSKTKSKNELNREFNSIYKFAKKNYLNKIIYISTADVSHNLLNKSLYVKNKIKIENFIKKKFKKYIIIRLPQIIGKSKNKNTLVNSFYKNIKENKDFTIVKNFKRNVLDIDDVIKVIKIIIKEKKIQNKTITLSNKYCIKPMDIVKVFEKKLNKVGLYKIEKAKKQIWPLNYKKNAHFFKKAKIRFDRNYLSKSISKYYK